MSEMMSHYGSDDSESEGTPLFAYVSAISDEEHRQALTKAFQRARKEAEHLAAATSSNLGKIRYLRAGQSTAELESEYYSAWQNYSAYAYAYQPSQPTLTPKPDRYEASGAQPGMVSYKVAVQVAFELE